MATNTTSKAIAAALCAAGLASPAASLAAAPRPIVRPVVVGTARPGATLSASTGRWRSGSPPSYAYQWRRCDARGRRCRPISGATGRVWDVFDEDRGASFQVAVRARNRSGAGMSVSPARPVVGAVAGRLGSGVTAVAVGDIACGPAENRLSATTCQQQRTADLARRSRASRVLLLGDIQYECGDPEEFGVFDASWGSLKPAISPVPGNHEYQNKQGLDADDRCAGSVAPPGAGYFGYFGPAAGSADAGYYSFDVGAWHVVALNSNCPFVACAQGSPQETWLRADLAATRRPCVMAIWHHPRFAGSGTPGDAGDLRPFWDDLQAAGADLVLNGHVHDYERFAPMRADGRRGAGGIRQFIVGTGGRSQDDVSVRPETNVEVQRTGTFGVLALQLTPRGYGWRFASTDGRFSDRGSDGCRG